MINATTLPELQEHIATACQLGNPSLAESSGNDSLAAQQRAQRRMTDFITARFARKLNGRSPEDISDEEREEIERKVTKRANRFAEKEKIERKGKSPEKCGFVPILLIIGQALLGVLFQKAWAAIWDWFFRAKAADCRAIGAEAALCQGCDDGEDD